MVWPLEQLVTQLDVAKRALRVVFPDDQVVKVAADDPLPVTLTVHNVEVVTVYNALAITEQTDHISSMIDLSKYKSIAIMARNSHDQNISLSIVSHAGAPSTRGVQRFDSAGTVQPIQATIVSQSDRWYAIHTHPSYADHIRFGLRSIRFNAVPSAPPTTGSLTVEIWGVPN